MAESLLALGFFIYFYYSKLVAPLLTYSANDSRFVAYIVLWKLDKEMEDFSLPMKVRL